MVAMIETLVARGHAYEAEGHVLFEVATDPDYGTLARRNLEDMRAGARVEVAPYKRDPMDFVLWKPSSDIQPGWDSPWGRGRPGWHIECSAMARDLLGDSFDIHGGGIDLAFPHHENECAQSRCAHPEGSFANIWMHNGFLNVEGEKMSKSLGNFFTVRDLLDKGVPGEVIRLVLLSTHYRQPLDWTESKVAEATALLEKWSAFTEAVEPAEPLAGALKALADDLNTPGAIAAMHEAAGAGDRQRLLATMVLMGVNRVEPRRPEALTDADRARIDALINARLAARGERDFARADALRDGLVAAGVVIMDRPSGVTEWERGPDFDATKLAGLKQ
jgi:cysteinyl-tRNA synthetase